MTMRILAAIAALLALSHCSCDSQRDLRIESNTPAVVTDRGGRVVCESTPCVMRVSRETCRFYDSSSGYIILDARSRDGLTLRSMPIVTCDVKNGMLLSFTFPSGSGTDCGTVLHDRGTVAAARSCGESLVK